jgi:hypothetical protein
LLLTVRKVYVDIKQTLVYDSFYNYFERITRSRYNVCGYGVHTNLYLYLFFPYRDYLKYSFSDDFKKALDGQCELIVKVYGNHIIIEDKNHIKLFEKIL